MKCIFCGAEVKMNEACQYCGSVAEPEYYGKQREQERKTEPEGRPALRQQDPSGCLCM